MARASIGERPTNPMMAHNAPCQGLSLKSSSKVALAHSQTSTDPLAARNRSGALHQLSCGNPGALHSAPAAASSASVGPSIVVLVSR